MYRRVAVAALVLVAVLIAAPASAPVRVSYVYSDSMSPTLHVNDGFVEVPAGHVHTGEIIVFHAPKRGGYTAHRVVAVTPHGFRTQGDNNPISDQKAGYGFVTRDEVYGQVLTVNGGPVVIPHLGGVIQFVRTNRLLLALVGVAGYLLTRYGGGDEREASRRPVTSHRLLALATVAMFVGLTTVTTLGAASAHMTFFVEQNPASQAPAPILQTGTAKTTTATFSAPAESAWTTTVGAARGATIVGRTRNETGATYRVRIPPQYEHGGYNARVSLYRFPAVLPRSVLRALAAVHPLLAAVAANGVLTAGVYLVSRVVIGRSVPIRPAHLRSLRQRWR